MGSLHIIFAFEFLVSYKRNLILTSKKCFASGHEMTDHRERPIAQPLGDYPSMSVTLPTVTKYLPKQIEERRGLWWFERLVAIGTVWGRLGCVPNLGC